MLTRTVDVKIFVLTLKGRINVSVVRDCTSPLINTPVSVSQYVYVYIGKGIRTEVNTCIFSIYINMYLFFRTMNHNFFPHLAWVQFIGSCDLHVIHLSLNIL